jgi:hypothetical protein
MYLMRCTWERWITVKRVSKTYSMELKAYSMKFKITLSRNVKKSHWINWLRRRINMKNFKFS